MNYLRYPQLEQEIGTPRPWLIGVLNLTPDSFSDGGHFDSPEKAGRQLDALLSSGAQIIDIGGESTGPGRSKVDAVEEFRRIKDILAYAAKQCFVSVDTYKAETARRCLELGARMINDVSALRADNGMAAVVREFNAFIVLMYSKETAEHPHASKSPKDYEDIIEDISAFLNQRIAYALEQGIRAEQIIIDPGMGGFLSPNPEYSWEVLSQVTRIKELYPEYPLLIGTSRKGFLGGHIEDRDPVSQLSGLAAYLKGADLIRTHNPAMAREFFEIWENIMG